MLLFTAHLAATVFLVALLGWPIGRAIDKSTDFTGVLFWSCLGGVFVTVVAWCLDITVGARGNLAKTLITASVVIGLVSLLRSRIRREPNVTRAKEFITVRSVTEPLLALLLTVVAALPVGVSLGDYSVPFRIGPDAIGNAVAASALHEGKTLAEIENDVTAHTATPNLKDVLAFEDHKLYETLDLRTQVRTEFLVAGLRWGLPSAVATVRSLPVQISIWQALSLVSSLGVFIAALGCLQVCKRLRARGLSTLVYTTGCTMSPILLYAWHEGGSSQIFSLPIVLATILVLMDERTLIARDVLPLALALSIALISYSDLWLLLSGLILLSMLTSALRKTVTIKTSLIPAFAILMSTIAVAPYSIRFLPYLSRRLQDAGIGGWSLPRWVGPTEILGWVNGFSQSSPLGIEPRSPTVQVITTILDPIVVGLVLGLAIRFRRPNAQVMWASAVLIVLAVYLKTRHLDHVTNYQYFKAASCLLPVLILPLTRLEGSMRNGKKLSTRQFFAIFAILLLATSTARFIETFRRQSIRLDTSEFAELNRYRAESILREINVVAAPELRNAALAAVTTLNWFGRAAFDKIEGSNLDWDRPLYLLVRLNDCPDWSCLARINRNRLVPIAPSITLVRLADDSKAFEKIKKRKGMPSDLSVVANTQFQALGGYGLINYRPVLQVTES